MEAPVVSRLVSKSSLGAGPTQMCFTVKQFQGSSDNQSSSAMRSVAYRGRAKVVDWS